MLNLKSLKLEWKQTEKILLIIEVLAIVGGVIFAGIQIKDWRDSQSAQLMLEFNRSLGEDTNSHLITAIENNSSILKSNGGEFTTTDIDRYLTVYELLNNVSEGGLINDTMLYNGFAYDIIRTFQNQEIKNYLSDIRKEDGTFFAGFESLARSLLKVDN